MSRTVLYSRVSTADKQNPEVQAAALRQFCKARGWSITEEIIDRVSGGTDKRPGLNRLLALVRSRQVDVVVVTKLDRLARSLRHLVGLLDEFNALGVSFVSLGDQIDLSTASGRLLVHLLGAFGEFERSLIKERTLAGLAYARSQGKRLGRPPVHSPQAILALRARGLSYRAIARELKAPMGSVVRAIRTAHKTPSSGPPKTSIKSRGRHG